MANDFEYNRTQEAGCCLRIEELRSFLTLNALHRVTVLVFSRHLAIALRNSTLLYTLMPTVHETITEENIDTMYNGFFFCLQRCARMNRSLGRRTYQHKAAKAEILPERRLEEGWGYIVDA